MADYQVCRWNAWHHRMAQFMLFALLLAKRKNTHPQTCPMLSLNELLTAVIPQLPRRQMGATELAEVIGRRYRNGTLAKDSHRRRQACSDSSGLQATNDGL